MLPSRGHLTIRPARWNEASTVRVREEGLFYLPCRFGAARSFKERQRAVGLIQEFDTPETLERLVASMLIRVVRERFGVTSTESTTTVVGAPRAAVRAQMLSIGSGHYELVMSNAGAGEARSVRITEGIGRPDGWEILYGDDPIDYLPAGSDVRLPAAIDMGSPPRNNLKLEWLNEDGTTGECQQTLTL
jgi:hypothetical protein